MHVTGIIAEYNPLHGGHISQIKRARAAGADYIIVAMSGDFVQRGEPAIFDKAARTACALMAGADLVLEIPVIFATASAPDFAQAAVTLLDKLNTVDTLCFGSECGDIDILTAAARILADEPDIFKETIQAHLRSGEPYPAARAAALISAFTENTKSADAAYLNELFSSPNNILGTEYIKTLLLRESNMRPLTYKREGQAYNDSSPVYLDRQAIQSPDDISYGGQGTDMFPSASAIRKGLKEGRFDYAAYLSGTERSVSGDGPDTAAYQPDSFRHPIFADDLSGLLNENILKICSGHSRDEAVVLLSSFSDLTPELASGLVREELNFGTFGERTGQLKSRAYSYARISRALLHLVLGITEADVKEAKQNDLITYARVLGFRKGSESLLSAIHKNSALPLITKTAGADPGADGRSCFLKDLYASHLYQSLVYSKYGIRLANEFNRPLIII